MEPYKYKVLSNYLLQQGKVCVYLVGNLHILLLVFPVDISLVASTILIKMIILDMDKAPSFMILDHLQID